MVVAPTDLIKQHPRKEKEALMRLETAIDKFLEDSPSTLVACPLPKDYKWLSEESIQKLLNKYDNVGWQTELIKHSQCPLGKKDNPQFWKDPCITFRYRPPKGYD